jgi:tetratricopeptide (TPR) repeat protein
MMSRLNSSLLVVLLLLLSSLHLSSTLSREASRRTAGFSEKATRTSGPSESVEQRRRGKNRKKNAVREDEADEEESGGSSDSITYRRKANRGSKKRKSAENLDRESVHRRVSVSGVSGDEGDGYGVESEGDVLEDGEIELPSVTELSSLSIGGRGGLEEGYAYLRTGKNKEACEVFERHLAMGSGGAQVHHGLTLCNLGRVNYTQALTNANTMIALSSSVENSGFYLLRGRIHALLMNWDEMVSDVNRYMKGTMESGSFVTNLISELVKEDRHGAARELMRYLESRFPDSAADPALYLQRSQSEEQLGLWEEAIESLERAKALLHGHLPEADLARMRELRFGL